MPAFTPLPTDDATTDHGEAAARLRIAPYYGVNISASNPGYAVFPPLEGTRVDNVVSIQPVNTMAGPHNADGSSTWGRGPRVG